jgi:hypothetical protein
LELVAAQDFRAFDSKQLQLLLHLLCPWQWLLAVKENHQVCAFMYPKRQNFQPFSQLFFTKIYHPLWGHWCDRAIGGLVAGDRLFDID